MSAFWQVITALKNYLYLLQLIFAVLFLNKTEAELYYCAVRLSEG